MSNCTGYSADALPRGTPFRPWATRSACEDLVRDHGAALQALARSLTSCASDARDLVQDTFERSLRCLPPGMTPEATRRWLCVTLRNRFLDVQRSFEEKRRALVEPAALLAIPTAEPEDEPPWAAIDSAQIWRCVERLNPALRDTFLTRVRGQRSHAEIASELGIPAATVGTRYFRALKQLRRMLEKELAAAGSPSRSNGTVHREAQTR